MPDPHPTNVVIHWFRRDLRLNDNLALTAAAQQNARVAPVFIFDPTLLHSRVTGAPRVQFMLAALNELDRSLRAQGTQLIVRYGDPQVILPALARQLNAQAVYANRDYSPFSRRRDADVARALHVPFFSFEDSVLRAPGDVLKDTGEPYTVYTPFMKRWRSLAEPLAPQDGPHSTPSGDQWFSSSADELPLPALRDLGFSSTISVPPVSEAAALARLHAFTSGPIYAYGEGRNHLLSDPFDSSSGGRNTGPSAISPYLRWGLLSPRQAYRAAVNALNDAPNEDGQKSVNTWINELIWREFFVHILYHFPHVTRGSFRPAYDSLPWRIAPEDFEAWCTGRTGYPIVDAAMRQLTQIGWLPNRARLIVASFLTKDLLIHWRQGEQHFMQWLIDGDTAANNGGWQWSAGTGTDVQPYFRIFNPLSQSQKFDPSGEYIRRWVPELRHLSASDIHAPWQMDTPPADYPAPIVDHTAARERALQAFAAIKE